MRHQSPAARQVEEQNQAAQCSRTLTEALTQQRDRSFALAQLQGDLRSTIRSRISVVTSPYTGVIRKIKILRQNDNYLLETYFGYCQSKRTQAEPRLTPPPCAQHSPNNTPSTIARRSPQPSPNSVLPSTQLSKMAEQTNEVVQRSYSIEMANRTNCRSVQT